MKTARMLAILLLLQLCCSSLWAQPTAFTYAVQPLDLVELVVPEPIDLQAVQLEDQQREQQGGPYRFAIAKPVMITPETDGMWEEIDDETLLWRLPIASPQALSLSLGFTRFFLPPGGRLFIYSADHSDVLGPFTEDDNKEHGQLWTPLIHSDVIIVELTIPVSEVPQLELELTSINHGYRGFDTQPILMGLGDSGDCHRNVVCPEGDPWRDQIRSVAGYYVTIEGYGSGWCTGALINNTAQDDKPYFLTAFHCFDGNMDAVLDDPDQAAKTMVVYWNYQASTCGGTWASDNQNQLGATFLAGYWASDFALVELDDKPSLASEVYYAGWDHSSSAPSSGVAIHHPKADTKKISIENNPLSKVGVVDPDPDPDIYYGDYFMVNEWDVGITEVGSSGSPFFNSNKRIVGQLRGSTGESSCATPLSSLFGPLYRSWSGGGTTDTRLRDWLDPLETGTEALDGKNPKGPCIGDTTTVTIGTGTSDWNYPMHTGYEDSRTEVIYLASEIGQSGTISALALDVTKVPKEAIKMNNWTIRMQHTLFFLGCSLDSTGWTVVYQNDETVNSTGWRTFEFQRPFEYNGEDNLIVDFSHNNRSSASHVECKSHPSFWPWGFLDHGSACAHSDSQYGDPLNWSGSTRPIVRCSNERPNVKLTICKESTATFEDTFPTTTINSTKWTVVQGATVDAVGINEPSGGYSLRLNGDDSVTSKVIDLSFPILAPDSGATLTYYYQRTGGGSSPENGDDLIIECEAIPTASPVLPPRRGIPVPPGPPVLVPADWIELARHPGDGPDMTSYQPNTITLPNGALHSDFRLRIRTLCSSVNDDWFVDDVKIEVTYGEIPSLR